MQAKRWWAILIAVVLVVFSIIISVTKTSDLREDFSKPYGEKIIEDGNPLKKIAVIKIEGTIMDTGDQIFGESTHQNILKQLDEAANDPRVKSVLLYVNSPGGGVVESAEIHDKILEIKDRDKLVYATMGNTAASGGYYVSAPADKIYAHPSTLTGSIGVIIQQINVTELAKDLGIDFNTIKSGNYKDILSPTREMTKEEEELLQNMVDDMYEDFVDVVVEGRNLETERVKQLGDGRVYTGKQAEKNGLVDALGTKEDALKALKEENDLEDAVVFEYDSNFSFSSLFGIPLEGIMSKNKKIDDLTNILNNLDGPRAMYLYAN